MFRHGWIFSALVIFVTACGGDSPELPAGEQQEVCSAEGGCEPGFRCADASCAPEVGGDDAVTQSDITPVDDIAAGPEDTVADDGPAHPDIQAPDVPPVPEYGGPYGEFMIGLNLDAETQALFATNAARFEEIVLTNIGHLKNALWSLHQVGYWSIYFHVEEWSGPVYATAIQQLIETYEGIANDWVEDLGVYDPGAPTTAEVRVFGFVFQEGIEIDSSFWDAYGDYPVVTGYTLTNEEAPWLVVDRDTGETFNQNWYQPTDFLDLRVAGNRADLAETVTFAPEDWSNYNHPADVDMFFTKFWHRVSWDAVAQRQYLKIGGQITDYQAGTTDESVFAHEMGHCFFLDDVYDPGKYPDGQSLSSLMNMSAVIEDFDRMTMRMVWKLQREPKADVATP